MLLERTWISQLHFDYSKRLNHDSVQVVLLASATLGISANAAAETVDFTDNGTFPTPFLIEGNVTVSGSNILFVLNGAGIGIEGGVDNTLLDPGETMSFAFATPVTDVVIDTYQAFDTGGSGLALNATLASGASIVGHGDKFCFTD
jgi:hypothetical protein